MLVEGQLQGENQELGDINEGELLTAKIQTGKAIRGQVPLTDVIDFVNRLVTLENSRKNKQYSNTETIGK